MKAIIKLKAFIYSSLLKRMGTTFFNQSCKRKVFNGTFRSKKVFITSENEDMVFEKQNDYINYIKQHSGMREINQ